MLCRQSQLKSLKEDRRNGAAAVRVTRISCLLPDRRSQKSTELQQQWLRKDQYRTISVRHSCDWWGSGKLLLGNRVSWLKVSGEKRQRGHLYSACWMFLKRWACYGIHEGSMFKQLQIVLTSTLHNPFLSRRALPRGYFCVIQRLEPYQENECSVVEKNWVISVLPLEWNIGTSYISKCLLRKFIR